MLIRYLLFIIVISANSNLAFSSSKLNLLQVQNPIFVLDIYGKGKESKNINNVITRNTLENKISLKGSYSDEDFPNLIVSYDAVILPSTYNEGLPLVLIESMHYNRPIFASRMGAIPELAIINDGIFLSDFDKSQSSNLIEFIKLLKRGKFNGTKINEMKELPKIVAQTEVGKTVDVKVWRNKKEIIKKIKLGRLETSEDFKDEKKEVSPETPEVSEIKSLKIIARQLNKKDIEQRKLPNQTTGLVITNIGKNSPVNYLNVGDVIVEAQKKKIKSIKDLEDIVNKALKSNQKTILIVIYNSQNQRRYIGVKLD